MMLATFNNNPSITIICYSPSNASDEKDLITFYSKLSSFVCSIPKHNVLIIGGDMKTTNPAHTTRQTEKGKK